MLTATVPCASGPMELTVYRGRMLISHTRSAPVASRLVGRSLAEDLPASDPLVLRTEEARRLVRRPTGIVHEAWRSQHLQGTACFVQVASRGIGPMAETGADRRNGAIGPAHAGAASLAGMGSAERLAAALLTYLIAGRSAAAPRAAAVPAPACIADLSRAEHGDGTNLFGASAVLWREAETEVFGELAAFASGGPAPPADDVNEVLFDAVAARCGLPRARHRTRGGGQYAGRAWRMVPATAAGWLEDLLAKQNQAPAAEAAAAAELTADATLDIDLNLAAPCGEAMLKDTSPPSPGVLQYPLDAPARQGVADAAGVSPPRR